MAASKTLETRWYVNGAGLTNGQTATFACSVGEHIEKKLVLTGEVGEGPKIPLKITATGIECISHEGSGGNGTAQIIQTGALGTFTAEDLQRWRLTGVTVSEPPNCAVEGGTVTTTSLKSEVFHDVADPTIIFKHYEPTTGLGGNVATIKVVNNVGICSVAGNRILKGTWFGEFENRTGVMAVNQPLTFSRGVDETAGGGLQLAGNPAHLTGTVNTELTGNNAGKPFGVKQN